VIKFARLKVWQFEGEWCKGSTAVFGTVDPGSNPGSPACIFVMKFDVDDDPHLGYQPKHVLNNEPPIEDFPMGCSLFLKWGMGGIPRNLFTSNLMSDKL
jgi:hypothetical protein